MAGIPAVIQSTFDGPGFECSYTPPAAVISVSPKAEKRQNVLDHPIIAKQQLLFEKMFDTGRFDGK